LSEETEGPLPRYPWRNPVRLRTRVVHGYWSVDVKILHTTAAERLVRLLRDAPDALAENT
jgi:uncharacterized protein with HEPN domain